MRQHAPFKSIYLDKFEVVEQLKGPTRLYPHIEQLPALSRALNLEFYSALPNRIARVDHRADDYHKILLYMAAFDFCHCINASRQDNLRLFPLVMGDRVTRVAVVQQVTVNSLHRFRFFTGNDFAPDVYLSGKRIGIADHVLERFSARVPHPVGADASVFLNAFYSAAPVVMLVGQSLALMILYGGGLLAFTFKDTDTEFILTTCLTVNEINSLQVSVPPCVVNLHYGPAFAKPAIRNWSPDKQMLELEEHWEKKSKIPAEHARIQHKSLWSTDARRIEKICLMMGRRPQSLFRFLDNIPGPVVRFYDDGQELRYDQRLVYRDIGQEDLLADDASPTGNESAPPAHMSAVAASEGGSLVPHPSPLPPPSLPLQPSANS